MCRSGCVEKCGQNADPLPLCQRLFDMGLVQISENLFLYEAAESFGQLPSGIEAPGFSRGYSREASAPRSSTLTESEPVCYPTTKRSREPATRRSWFSKP